MAAIGTIVGDPYLIIALLTLSLQHWRIFSQIHDPAASGTSPFFKIRMIERRYSFSSHLPDFECFWWYEILQGKDIHCSTLLAKTAVVYSSNWEVIQLPPLPQSSTITERGRTTFFCNQELFSAFISTFFLKETYNWNFLMDHPSSQCQCFNSFCKTIKSYFFPVATSLLPQLLLLKQLHPIPFSRHSGSRFQQVFALMLLSYSNLWLTQRSLHDWFNVK